MTNVSTGFGLCAVAVAALAYPFVSSLAPSANANSVPTAVLAANAAAVAQVEPTIVWYGTYGGYCTSFTGGAVLRAWSDGTLEIKKLAVFAAADACSSAGPCSSPWFVISSPTSGFSAASDINFDERVDGADLGRLLADYGDAPRQDVPPTDCPLNLINP